MVKVDDTLIAWIIGGAALLFTLDSVLTYKQKPPEKFINTIDAVGQKNKLCNWSSLG